MVNSKKNRTTVKLLLHTERLPERILRDEVRMRRLRVLVVQLAEGERGFYDQALPCRVIQFQFHSEIYTAVYRFGEGEAWVFYGDHDAWTAPYHRAAQAIKSGRERTEVLLHAAFWDGYLRGDAAAKAWLDGDGSRSLLEKNEG